MWVVWPHCLCWWPLGGVHALVQPGQPLTLCVGQSCWWYGPCRLCAQAVAQWQVWLPGVVLEVPYLQSTLRHIVAYKLGLGVWRYL